MVKSNRIAALEAILQARRNEIDQLAGRLNVLRARQTEIERDIQTINKRRDDEGLVHCVEAAPFLASFLSALAAQQASLTKEAARIEDEAKGLEKTVRDKFIEMKTWDISLARLRQEKRAADWRQETRELDEIGRIARLSSGL